MNADRSTRQNNRFKDKTASSGLGSAVVPIRSIKVWELLRKNKKSGVGAGDGVTLNIGRLHHVKKKA